MLLFRINLFCVANLFLVSYFKVCRYFPQNAGRQTGTCYGTKIVFLYGLAKVFPFYLLSFNTRVSAVMMFIR